MLATTMFEVQHYLSEVPAEPPCGPDLTYDNEFQAMESSAREKPEQQFGDTVIPAEPPDWRDVERQATALIERTKDLRIAALLCRAWTVLHGLPGTARGLQLCAALLERHWAHVHPLPEDEDDYFMRMNALGMLSDVTGFLRELRDTEFLRGTFGCVSVRDAEALAKGNVAEDAPNLSIDELRMLASRANAEEHPSLQALGVCLSTIEVIQRICGQHLPSNQMPETLGFCQLLQALRTWGSSTPSQVENSSDVSESNRIANPDGTSLLLSVDATLSAVHNRDQSIAILLAIADQLEKAEPANPAPLFIRRGARFMGMNFLDIVRELSPESISHIEIVTGVQSREI